MSRGCDVQRGMTAALGIFLVAAWVASCAPRVEGPAPVVSGETADRAPLSITIERGQTLFGIAQSYHVPMRIIAEANRLSSPYSTRAGRVLTIPAAGRRGPPTPPKSMATLPPPRNEFPPGGS